MGTNISVNRRTKCYAIARAGARAIVIATTAAVGSARAEGPVDLPSAFARTFQGANACVALRDVAPGAGTAVSEDATCQRRLPPCATFELPATVIAIDRGVVPDANTPVKRNPPVAGDAPGGVNLRDAFRGPVPWVYEEIARRIGSDGFNRALAAMRYGNADAGGPVERIGRGENNRGLALNPVEQVDFLARLKRGELPTSAESQSRTVELIQSERVGDATIHSKSGGCDGAAWTVGWVARAERSVIFAAVEAGPDPSVEDVAARTRRLLGELALAPAVRP